MAEFEQIWVFFFWGCVVRSSFFTFCFWNSFHHQIPYEQLPLLLGSLLLESSVSLPLTSFGHSFAFILWHFLFILLLNITIVFFCRIWQFFTLSHYVYVNSLPLGANFISFEKVSVPNFSISWFSAFHKNFPPFDVKMFLLIFIIWSSLFCLHSWWLIYLSNAWLRYMFYLS